ncbi:MAG TPA: fasciclin domain-containing protein [Cyclobacteriaceae bacterium]|nr:fasciclin domain-containing protein [Cyclobacteriaceae bacterium]HRJ82855.1 fasciclin domain-containing protein [Cyclobacteriaceae bacterium]
MKKLILYLPLLLLLACGQQASDNSAVTASAPVGGGQSNVKDDTSKPDVVRVAVNSNVHKTLVAALQAADYVDALSNAGPFTVFAPTDDAFAKLPASTVENLVKPENKATLQHILEYHVYVGNIREEQIRDGMTLNQVNLDNVTLNVSADGKITINGANVLGSVSASNGTVYVIDTVLLPPDKK